MMEVHQVQIKLQQRQSLMEIIMDQEVINLTTKRQHGQLLLVFGKKHKTMRRRDWRIKKRQDGTHLISSKQLSKDLNRLGKMLMMR